MVHVQLLYTRLRAEERLLLEAAEARGVQVTPTRDADLVLDMDGGGLVGDLLLARSLSSTRSLHALRACRAAGHPSVNTYDTAANCADKAETSLRLARAGVPTPRTAIAFDQEAALGAMDRIGYPIVLKPTGGSWARLVARADDRGQAAQILEHRAALPNPQQHVYYMQEYIDTRRDDGHRDIRAFVVGDRTIAAIERVADQWITNTARGAQAGDRPVTGELDDLCQRAAAAVGGGALAIDLMEGPDGLLVHEINHNMEFRNSIGPTGVDIPGAVIEHCIEVARR